MIIAPYKDSPMMKHINFYDNLNFISKYSFQHSIVAITEQCLFIHNRKARTFGWNIIN